ncbi:hypothetical protein B0H13DRAFT_1889909, partial [Mycena leptocephala]
GSRSTLPIHTPSGSRALAHSRKGPELQRAARGRAIQRVRVSRAAWRLVAELHGIFERACIGSRRGWMASGGDGGGVRDEKRVPRPLQPAVCDKAEKAMPARGTLAACIADTVGATARLERGCSRGRGPDGGAGAEHQGTQTQLLRMHLVLRVVRSGCTAGVSFERRDSIGQDTVARVERDGVKDATLQSVNRASVRREVHRTVKDNEGRSGRGRGRSREKRRERGEKRTKIARFPLTQIHRRRGSSGRVIDASMLWPGHLDSSGMSATANRPHLKNLNVEDQWELGRGKGQAGARRSVSTGESGKHGAAGADGSAGKAVSGACGREAGCSRIRWKGAEHLNRGGGAFVRAAGRKFRLRVWYAPFVGKGGGGRLLAWWPRGPRTGISEAG